MRVGSLNVTREGCQQQQQQGMFLHRLAALCYVTLRRVLAGEGSGVRRKVASQLGVACYIIIGTITLKSAQRKSKIYILTNCFVFVMGCKRGYDGVKSICLVSLWVSVCVCVTFCIWPEWGLLLLSYIVAFCEIGPGLQMHIVVGVECWAQRYELRVRIERGKCANISGILLGG